MPSKKHTLPEFRPCHGRQQAAAPFIDDRRIYTISGGKHKHSPTRKWAKLEFVQAVLLMKIFDGFLPPHISGREKPLVRDVNKNLADDPNYIYGPVSSETVARAVRLIRNRQK